MDNGWEVCLMSNSPEPSLQSGSVLLLSPWCPSANCEKPSSFVFPLALKPPSPHFLIGEPPVIPGFKHTACKDQFAPLISGKQNAKAEGKGRDMADPPNTQLTPLPLLAELCSQLELLPATCQHSSQLQAEFLRRKVLEEIYLRKRMHKIPFQITHQRTAPRLSRCHPIKATRKNVGRVRHYASEAPGAVHTSYKRRAPFGQCNETPQS